MQVVRPFISKFVLFALVMALGVFAVACATPTAEPTKPAASSAASSASSSVVASSSSASQAPTATKVPPTVPPAPTAAPTSANTPKRGGRITIALWQSPATLNGFLNTGQPMEETLVFVVEGLLQTMPDGTYGAVLAKEVP